MAKSGDLGVCGVHGLGYLLASGRLTATELVTDRLAAVEASQPALNAFGAVFAESALAQARAADERRSRGESGPLLGIPIAVNGDIDVAGTPTTYGTATRPAPATTDAEVVRRLRAAGAVVIGKTNTGEFGQSVCTTGADDTFTRNPWNRLHTPGCSSGGAAAAVAAGLVAAAVGSDSGGGVRIPAAWTNLVGLKPQRGRISTHPHPESFNGLTCYGILATSAADAASVLEAAGGSADTDLHRPPAVALSECVQHPPGPLTIAISTRFPFTGARPRLHADIEDAMDGLADTLELLGHRVVTGGADYGSRLMWNYVSRTTAGLAEVQYELGRYATSVSRNRFNAGVGWFFSQRVLSKARRDEARSRRRIGTVFENVDVIVTPTTARPAPAVTAFDGMGKLATNRAMIEACPTTWPWNVLGWPAVNVPAGFTADGLPIGAQLMGPANSEPMLLSLATGIEAVTPFAARRPEPWWAGPPGAPDQSETAAGRPRSTSGSVRS